MADSFTTNTTRPTIVLTHGICHSPPSYIKFTNALRSAGYDVYVPYLPSCTGVRPPKAGLAEDTQLVRRLVEMLCDQGRTVIMVMHSYGGMVGCNALEGLDVESRRRDKKSGGVIHLVGIAAHIYPAGFSILDMIHEMGNDDLIPVAFDIAPDESCFFNNARARFFSDLSDEGEANALMCTLSRANIDCMEAKFQFEAWKHIPVTYVLTLADMTIPVPYQKRILEKMEEKGVKVEVVEMDSGHSPFVTKTADVVALIEKVASNS